MVSLSTQSERTHQDTQGYVKATAQQIRQALINEKGYQSKNFSVGTVNNIMNRLGYTLKKVRKALPLKRIEATDAIFSNVHQHLRAKKAGVLKISLDVKDKVKVGQLSRNGYHRGKEDVLALDKDQHWETSLVPLGILEIDSAKSTVILGNSYETADFIVDGLSTWYEMRKEDLQNYHSLEIYLDNGPSVSGSRSQFINRMMEFACITGLKVHLIYYPPYHSKYNPIERVWAAVENYWSGTLLTSVQKVVNTIANVTWKGVKLVPALIDKVYQKGVKLSKKEMNLREQLIDRNPRLPKWDITLSPSLEMGRLFIE